MVGRVRVAVVGRVVQEGVAARELRVEARVIARAIRSGPLMTWIGRLSAAASSSCSAVRIAAGEVARGVEDARAAGAEQRVHHLRARSPRSGWSGSRDARRRCSTLASSGVSGSRLRQRACLLAVDDSTTTPSVSYGGPSPRIDRRSWSTATRRSPGPTSVAPGGEAVEGAPARRPGPTPGEVGLRARRSGAGARLDWHVPSARSRSRQRDAARASSTISIARVGVVDREDLVVQRRGSPRPGCSTSASVVEARATQRHLDLPDLVRVAGLDRELDPRLDGPRAGPSTNASALRARARRATRSTRLGVEARAAGRERGRRELGARGRTSARRRR